MPGPTETANQNKTTVVLKIPPVDSPYSAVKIAIASKKTAEVGNKH